MHVFKSLIILHVLLCSTLISLAQKKPVNKPDVAYSKKFKVPKLQTLLDIYKDSVSISTETAETIIALPLKIYDDKKNEYSISSYQFMYKRKVVTEDEKTGKAIATNSISADRFKISPLPELWVNLIRQDVKPGEEFYFFDVIAKDTQGRVMYAPNLKIMIR